MVGNLAQIPLPVSVPDEQSQWTTVGIREVVDRGSRLEASYYGIAGKQARSTVLASGFRIHPLCGGDDSLATSSYSLPRFRRIFVDKGIPIYTSFQCLEFDPKPTKFISGKTNADLDALTLREGQVVVTCSGTVGRVAYVGKSLAGKVFSHDLIRLEFGSAEDAAYAYSFLRTGIGYASVTASNYGSVVSHIEPEHLKSVLVPEVPDSARKQITSELLRAFRLRDEASQYLADADEFLHAALDLPYVDDFAPSKHHSVEAFAFTIRARRLEQRLEATFHSPTVSAALVNLGRAPAEITTCDDLRVSSSIFLPGRFKRVYVDEEYGVPFLSGKNLFQINPVDVKYLSRKQHGKIIDGLRLEPNSILVTCSGTIGRVQIAPQYWKGWTCNQHVLRLRPAHVNPGYVYCYLASDYGSLLISRCAYGSVVSEITDQHLGSVPFPIPHDRNITDSIGDLVLKAASSRDAAFELERHAVSLLEAVIKKGSSKG